MFLTRAAVCGFLILMGKGLWITSHLVALGFGLVGGGLLLGGDGAAKEEDGPSRSSRRVSRSHQVSGEQLFEVLKLNHGDALTRYERLKKDLPVASDHERAVARAFTRLPKFMNPANGKFDNGLLSFEGVEFFHQLEGEDGERVAEFEVRVLHWLRDDRDACMAFLEKSFAGDFERHVLRDSVIVDYAMEADWNDVIPWMKAHSKFSIDSLVRRKLEEGGGFEVIQEARNAGAPSFLLLRALKGLPFSERDQVLDYALSNHENRNMNAALRDYLASGSHPKAEMVRWIRGVWDSGRIDEEKRGTVSRLFGEFLQGAGKPDDSEWRQGFIADYTALNPDSYWNEKPPQDVKDRLNAGRDYRFEFRHGRVSAEDVLKKMQAELTGELEEDVVRKEVFKELVAEAPERALSLVQGLEETVKKDLFREAGFSSFHEENPEVMQAYLKDLPGEWSSREKENLLFGWAHHSLTNVSRYGHDYLDWIVTLPKPDEESERPESRSRFFLERHTNWRIKTTYPEMLGEWRERLAESKEQKK